MKKQKFMKLSAFTSEPDLGNSFTAPVSHNGEISVVFRGKDISIHGWDGSAWTTIYTWNNVDKQFTFDNTYQNYFLKSLTGSEESVGVSFFSTSRYAGSTPSLAGIDRDVKLYDIDEVPIYTASDEGKFLTIRTDGSLAWLLANESFTVESEGGEEQAPSPTLLSQAVPYGDASYDASTDVMTFDGTGDYATFGGDYAFTDAITVAAWFKTTSGGDRRIMSSHVRSSSQFLNGWFMRLNGGQLKYRHPSGGAGELTGPSGLNDGEWQHVAMTWTPSGYVLYVNGAQHASGGAGTADGYDMSFDLHIGANPWNGNSPYAFFNGQIGGAIVENEAMTAEQIQAIYDNGPEYVESAGGEESQTSSASPGSIVGLEEDANLTLHGNAQLIDGVLHVDGTSGTYASLPHSLDYDRESGDLTISMWFKANELPNNWNAGLVSKMGSGWIGYITAISTMAADDGSGNMTEGGLQTSTWAGGGSNNNNRAKPAGGISLNEWHHVAYVMPATGDYKMYFNGVEIHSYVPASRNTTTTGDLRLGGWHQGSYSGYFNGQLDGIKIEKVAKSAEQILSEYSGDSSSEAPAGTPNVSGGLEVLETNTLSGDAQVTSHEGLLITNAGFTDTQSNYHNGATEQTISAWFKASELGTVANNSDTQWRDNGHIVAITRDYVAGGNRANGFMIAVSSNKIRIAGPHGANKVVSVNYNFSIDTWYKIDMAWNSNTMVLYVNGVNVAFESVSGSVAGGAVNLRIGRNIQDWMKFKGNILGVKVENVRRTHNEIAASYQSEAP